MPEPQLPPFCKGEAVKTIIVLQTPALILFNPVFRCVFSRFSAVMATFTSEACQLADGLPLYTGRQVERPLERK